MTMGVNSCMKWSMLELRGLLEDEDACVHFKRSKRHLGLHPFQLNDLSNALQEILASNVNFYDSDLQGLVLAYKNPKLLGPLGGILHDSYFIHVDIEADFYIFKPEIGCTLKGITNKKAANHVGVLVHKAFNVSIPMPDECQEWEGDSVSIGDEVKFIVTDLDFKGKLPFIRGELLPDTTRDKSLYNRTNNKDNEGSNEKISPCKKNFETMEKVDRKKGLNLVDEEIDSKSRMDGFQVEASSNGKRELSDMDSSSDERNRRKKKRKKDSVQKATDENLNRREMVQTRDIPYTIENTCTEEAEAPVEKKLKFSQIVKSEKSVKATTKEKDVDSVSKSKKLDNKMELLNIMEIDHNIVASRTKRTRNNRILDSDSEDGIKIETNPDIVAKKKKKKKVTKQEKEEEEAEEEEEEEEQQQQQQQQHEAEAEKEVVVEEKETKKKKKKHKVEKEEEEEEGKERKKKYAVEFNTVSETNAENKEHKFIKPEIKSLTIQSGKCKEKRRVNRNENKEDESSDSPPSNVAESKNENGDDFFLDIRVKPEPEPSDCEDIPLKKRDKKRERRQSIGAKKTDKVQVKKVDNILSDGIVIKTEPDISDNEGSVRSKKKSRRRRDEDESLNLIKIKVEPDASDVEGASTRQKKSLKTEPRESSKTFGSL